MPNQGGVSKPRRKLATYGKASRRAFLGFQQSSIPTAMSDDEKTSRRIANKPIGGIQRENALSTHADFSCDSRSLSSTTHGHSARPMLHAVGALSAAPDSHSQSNGDDFDFPSSDDELPPLTSKTKPVTKRRKLQSNVSDCSTAMEIDGVISESRPALDVQVPSPSKKHKPTKTFLRNTKSSSLVLGGNSTAHVKARVLGDVRIGMNRIEKPATSRITVRRNDSDLAERDSRQVFKGATLSHNITSRDSYSPRETSLEEYLENPREWISHPERRRSPPHESGWIDSNLSENLPETPARDPAVSSSSSTYTFNTEHSKYHHPNFLSPSGLDLPNLHITASPSATTTSPRAALSGNDPNLNKDKRIQNRIKLKDRLAFGRPPPDDRSPETEGSGSSDEAVELNSVSFFSEPNPDSKGPLSVDIQAPDNTHYLEPQVKFTEPVPSISTRGLKVTYAARNRTVLKDESEDALLGMPVVESFESPRASRRIVTLLESQEPRGSQGVSDDFNDPDNSQGGTLKSIHELREAGVNARVTRETEAVLDDIDHSTTTSQKRSALIDLATKLQVLSYSQQLTNSGLETRLLPHIVSNGDVIVDTLLMIILLQIISGSFPSHFISQLNQPSVLTFIVKCLENEDDLLTLSRNRKSSIPKAVQREIRKMCGTLKESALWRDGRPSKITARVVSLQCLEYLVRYIREAGSSQDVLSKDAVASLVTTVVPTPAALSSEAVDTFNIQLALSILESSTIAYASSVETPERLWMSHSIQHLAQFLTSIGKWQAPNMRQIWTLTLRVCLNLTNGSPPTCELFSTISVIEGVVGMVQLGFHELSAGVSEEDHDLTVDNLVLSLAFLINLAENKEKIRKLFLISTNESKAPLDALLELFTTRLQAVFEVVSEEESKSNVPFGYLAVLLSYLSINITTRQRVAAALQGGTLRQLLDAAEAFLFYHRKVAEEIRQADDEIDLKAIYIAKLQVVVDMLKREESTM